MQTVALKPGRAEWTAMSVGLFLLCVLMLSVPVLCLPLAVASPLLACPLAEREKEKWLAWLSVIVPAASSLAAGYDTLYAVSLILPGLVPMLITRLLPMPKRPGAKGMLIYLAAVTLSALVAVAAAGYALGGPLQVKLAEAVTDWVARSERKNELLRRLALAGIITLPDGYDLMGESGRLLQAEHARQMLMSLKLSAEMLVAGYLPSIFMQVCMTVGLFIPLRLERANGVLLVVETKTPAQKQTRVVAPPSFRLLTLPPNLRRLWLGMALGGILLLLSETDVLITMGQVCVAAAQTVGCLLGAAVVVFMYTKNDPERRVTGGVFAALLLLFAPGLMLAVGIADQIFHLRTPQAHKPGRTKGGKQQ